MLRGGEGFQQEIFVVTITGENSIIRSYDECLFHKC